MDEKNLKVTAESDGNPSLPSTVGTVSAWDGSALFGKAASVVAPAEAGRLSSPWATGRGDMHIPHGV